MSNKEVIYADDIDFVTEEVPNLTSITNTMHIFNLKVNTNKTEITTLSPTNLETIATKKLGIHLSMARGIPHRKAPTLIAMNKM